LTVRFSRADNRRGVLSLIAALVGTYGFGLSANVAEKAKPPLPCKFKGSKTYPGDDASKQALAQWMAEGARKSHLPVEMPVMGALVASGLQNLSHGDADSVGFFQMRVSIWDRGPYAGFPQNPNLQLQWFMDQAVLVEKRRIAQGTSLRQLLTNDRGYGDWVADVLIPPEQFRGRYQLQLDEARSLICS
jgi:hypothetical protein